MHIQIVTFRLKGMSHDDYVGLSRELAPRFAELSGLLSKTWLSDREANAYGGVYVWKDADAADVFARSELFATVAANESFADLESVRFDVLEAATRITRGPVTKVTERA